jgi:hypothetical protein
MAPLVLDVGPNDSCNNRRVELRYDQHIGNLGAFAMADGKKKKYDLGSSGTITLHVSEDSKRLLIEFDVEKEGLTKTGVNGLIDALEEIRKKMSR